jgi:glycerophosphoryl diester phosphodiesterase
VVAAVLVAVAVGGAASAYPALHRPAPHATFHPAPAGPDTRVVATVDTLDTPFGEPAAAQGLARGRAPTAPPSKPAAAPAPARPRYQVQVIGHRGAPAYRPQHTLEGYQLAIDQGADFVEPDLVMTKDGHLIARHESDLTETTDVRRHPELASLARGGRWYAEHLTLEQVKTLYAVGGPAAHSGRYRIPTLAEIVALVKRQPRRVGLYAELKAPGYLRSIGLAPEEPLAATLRAAGWTGRSAPVFVESFEPDSLRRVRKLTDVRLVQLVWGGAAAAPLTPAALDVIARYADVVAVDRDRLHPYLTAPPADADHLVKQAAARGLAVHVFTFGWRNPYGAPPAGFTHPTDPAAWAAVVPMYRAFYALGVAAVFTDAPDIAVYARG